MSTATATNRLPTAHPETGQYLTFSLGGELYLTGHGSPHSTAGQRRT
jgi:hypothetical protein